MGPARRVIVEIRGNDEDKKDVLQACLEKMAPEDISEVFKRLDGERLCEVTRKVHGVLYARCGMY